MKRLPLIMLVLVYVLALVGFSASGFILNHDARKDLAEVENSVSRLKSALELQQNGYPDRGYDQPENKFIAAGSHSLAAADFQMLLDRIAHENDCRIASIRIDATPIEDDRSAITKLSAELKVSGETLAIRNFLHHVETATPVAFIRRLSMTASTSHAPDEREPRLVAELTIESAAVGTKPIGAR